MSQSEVICITAYGKLFTGVTPDTKCQAMVSAVNVELIRNKVSESTLKACNVFNKSEVTIKRHQFEKKKKKKNS